MPRRKQWVMNVFILLRTPSERPSLHGVFPPALPLHPVTVRRVLPWAWGYQEGSAFTSKPSHTDTQLYKKKIREGRESEQQREVACARVCVFGVQRYSNPFCCDKVCQSSCSQSATAKDNTHTHTHTKNGSQRSVIWWAGGGERKISDGLWMGNRDQERSFTVVSLNCARFKMTRPMFS